MNKKLKRMAVVGATVLMTASSVGFSNAMQVKKSCDLNLTGKMYVCINGKRFNNLYAMIVGYVSEGKVDNDLMIAGYLNSNLIYEKNEGEN